jgi:hypothetical protein
MGQAGDSVRKGGGVVVRDAAEVYKHRERWFYTTIEGISVEQSKKLDQFLLRTVRWNQGYDKALIFRYFFPWVTGDDLKYICSEYVDEAIDSMESAWLTIDAKKPSPFKIALELWQKDFRFRDMASGKEIAIVDES